MPQGQIGRVPCLVAQRTTRFLAETHWLVGRESIQHESGRVCLEQPIDSLNQGFRGALVIPEGITGTGAILGVEIGKNIGIAKAVDGLFGIADQKQRPAFAIDFLENAELQGVGILEFIDQGAGETCFQLAGKFRQIG